MVGGGDEIQIPLKKPQPGIKVGNEIISFNMLTPSERYSVNIARGISM
jgi:autonomous glycyl radical cofactor GrcA